MRFKLDTLLKKYKIEQKDIVNGTGINKSTISRYVSNSTNSLVKDHLDLLCKYFNCNVNDILEIDKTVKVSKTLNNSIEFSDVLKPLKDFDILDCSSSLENLPIDEDLKILRLYDLVECLVRSTHKLIADYFKVEDMYIHIQGLTLTEEIRIKSNTCILKIGVDGDSTSMNVMSLLCDFVKLGNKINSSKVTSEDLEYIYRYTVNVYLELLNKYLEVHIKGTSLTMIDMCKKLNGKILTKQALNIIEKNKVLKTNELSLLRKYYESKGANKWEIDICT